MNEWVRRKLRLAEGLANGECGGGYDDAFLVLSSVMSAVAAALWPKKEHTDRMRFVELWARYAAPELHPNLISLPLLIQGLREKDNDAAEELRRLREEFLEFAEELDDLVVTGGLVDVPENEVLAVTRGAASVVRQYSYGNLYYRYYRSGYVHEYTVGSHGDAVRLSEVEGAVAYESWMDPPHRRINFDVRWITDIARTVCTNVAADWRRRPLPLPEIWWINGA